MAPFSIEGASTKSGAVQEYFLGQSWVVTPAPLEDLRKAEAEWAKLAALLSAKGEAGE